MHRNIVPLLAAGALLLGACSEDSASHSTDPTTSTALPSTLASAGTTTPVPMSLACDPLDERACLLPWPNDAFTVPDPSTATGRRLHLASDAPPANAGGVNIDVTDQNRADGFSPGSTVLALVPGLDVATSAIAGSNDIGASLVESSPIVLLDTTTGSRVPYWAELDAHSPSSEQLLMIHPATSLPEGHHVVVALRSLKNSAGATIVRSAAFQAGIDGTPEPPERTTAFRDLLAVLADEGVGDDDLYLAWDFTVASAQSLSGRALHMRDQAYAELGDAAPAFEVSDLHEVGNVRTIDGTYEVPNFLTGDGSPGSSFVLDANGLPVRSTSSPMFTADFRCVVPIAPAAPAPAPAIVYGHGLLGDRGEVDALSFAAEIGLAAACATDEIGMSSDDIGNLAAILGDLSHFHEQADRMQQGLLNQLLLGRLLNHADGFVSSPAFQSAGGSPLIAAGSTQFVGNSQGGILGGAASAISNEWSRVVLGVPGINYSLLLPRSSDWPQFQVILEAAYPDPVDRVLALQLIQLLWDRGENDGYAQHLTSDAYPGTKAKQVLLVEAFGDHQVSNVSTEVLARTIDASAHDPSIAAGRSDDVDPLWGIEALDPAAPTHGILVLWDYGTPAPPPVNLPPTEPEFGKDPHGAGSDEPLVLQQALTFLLTGEFTDVCSAAPCHSAVLAG